VSIPTVDSNVNIVVAGTNRIVATTTGANVTGTFDVTGAVSGGSLSVTGTSNLGAVGNVTITGGTTGQVLTTDGSGVLSWSTAAGGVSNGTSNVSIPTVDSNVNIVVAGTNRIVATTTGANVTGTLTTTGNIISDGGVKVGTVYTAVSTASTGTVDCSTSNYFTFADPAAITVLFSNVPTGVVYSCTLDFAGGTGAITFPIGVNWTGGSAQSRPSVGKLLTMMVTIDGGLSWYASSLTF
jgi:hypothetical protein